MARVKIEAVELLQEAERAKGLKNRLMSENSEDSYNVRSALAFLEGSLEKLAGKRLVEHTKELLKNG